MEFLVIGLLITGGLPLLAYGGVLVAGVMGLAAQEDSSVRPPLLLRIVEKTFLWGTLAYPFVYIPSAMSARDSDTATALVLTLIPPAYVVFMALLFLLWERLQKSQSK